MLNDVQSKKKMLKILLIQLPSKHLLIPRVWITSQQVLRFISERLTWEHVNTGVCVCVFIQTQTSKQEEQKLNALFFSLRKKQSIPHKCHFSTSFTSFISSVFNNGNPQLDIHTTRRSCTLCNSSLFRKDGKLQGIIHRKIQILSFTVLCDFLLSAWSGFAGLHQEVCNIWTLLSFTFVTALLMSH